MGLLAIVAWNPAGNFWLTVETPKAQCEAYDAHKLASAVALGPDLYAPAKLDRLVREPQNTVSNLPYATVGLAIWFAARRTLSRAFALSCLFLSVGSGLYHASLLPEWRLIDILGVYAALLTLLAVGVAALRGARRESPRAVLLTSGVVLMAAVAAGIHRNEVRFGGVKIFDSTYFVVASIALGTALAVIAGSCTIDRGRYRLALGALAISAPLAFLGGLGDRFGGFIANPEGALQGHSVWHALGAVALLAAYESFASTGYDRSVFRKD